MNMFLQEIPRGYRPGEVYDLFQGLTEFTREVNTNGVLNRLIADNTKRGKTATGIYQLASSLEHYTKTPH